MDAVAFAQKIAQGDLTGLFAICKTTSTLYRLFFHRRLG
jgi:hypothetical protein